ncbi:MAG TPA: PLP-dependent aspartate aminotransferase family protein [Methanomassiliicoccales archaeon]|jgi:cystathionine gamma-lyase
MRFETKAIHVGEEHGRFQNGDVVVPIHLSSTFARNKMDDLPGGYHYSRAGNPTRAALEERLAVLENGSGGLAFSSGMAAETALLFLLKTGDRVLACNDIYGGTYRMFNECFPQFGVNVTYLDFHDHRSMEQELKAGKEMIWLETPTNPTLRVYDIRYISENAHRLNPNTIVVVDNTFASPYFQSPLDLGADVVVHSTTKYIAGHSDVIGGALVSKDKELLGRLKKYQRTTGAIPGPFDVFLTLRGIKTLALRMQRHEENARAVADFLSSHELVKKVLFPGLDSHPDHELAKRQMKGYSGMVSFEVNDSASAIKLTESTRIFALAESLGGVESLIEHPSSMTHRMMPREERLKAGIGDNLIRLSVGIEHKDDLIEDLEQALKNSHQ